MMDFIGFAIQVILGATLATVGWSLMLWHDNREIKPTKAQRQAQRQCMSKLWELEKRLSARPSRDNGTSIQIVNTRPCDDGRSSIITLNVYGKRLEYYSPGGIEPDMLNLKTDKAER